MTVAMRRFFSSSLALWLVVTVVGAYFLTYIHHYVNFGIDLVGGTYITLEVKVEKAVENELADRMQSSIQLLSKNNMPTPVGQKVSSESAVMTFANERDASQAEQFLSSRDSRLHLSREDVSLVITLLGDERKTIETDAVQSNINVLRTRVDKFGVGEITIAAQGDRNIIVELPNVHNPQQAKAIIGKAALLELKLVEDFGRSEQELLERYGGQIPEGMMIVPGQEFGASHFYLVPAYTDLTGRLLKNAYSDQGGRTGIDWVVKFEFKPEGGDKFYELTSANIGRPVAVIVDGVVISAPTIQDAISTEGSITGNFTPESAKELATLLKSGAFVAPVSFEEERTIGPSLGQGAIRSGLIACAVSLVLLLLFSVFFYKVAGVLAFVVLLYNLLLILFMLSLFGATLTLPGIAGMILTIGMAIDASILIYERIREELHSGATLRKAVDTGFSGAMTVILDANVTHLLVAIVLYKLGAGPIQGFAVTMIVGILSTLLTGLVLLRALFNFAIDVLRVQKISI